MIKGRRCIIFKKGEGSSAHTAKCSFKIGTKISKNIFKVDDGSLPGLTVICDPDPKITYQYKYCIKVEKE